MEKVIAAVVTTLLCSVFSGEGQEKKNSKEVAKDTIQVESVKVENPSKRKEIAAFDQKEIIEKVDY